MSFTTDILGLGALAVDDILFIETFPPPDEKRPVLKKQRHCGGLAGTALVAAAKLGAGCAYAGVVGPDELSSYSLANLKNRKVDVSGVTIDSDARVIHSVILIDQKNQTRNIFYDLNGYLGASSDAPSASLIEAAKVLLVDNLSVPGMIRAATIARNAGIPRVA